MSSNGFRLSPQQAHLWAQLVPSPDTPYRAQCVVELRGPLDKPRLERAVREVVSRNEILRTTYRRLPGTETAVQVPGDVPATVLRELDWTGPRAQWWSHLLEDLLLGPAEDPWSYTPEERAPEEPGGLWLATLEPERHLLVVDLPALSADRQGLACLVRELAGAWVSQGGGEPLPGPSMRYAEVSEVFQQLLESETAREGQRHWEGLALPAPEPHGFERTFSPSSWRPRELPPGFTASVKAAASRIGVPVTTFVLACWQLLLARLSERLEWSVAVRFDGRTYEGLEEAIGLFERYLPLRCEVHARARFADFAREVARATQDTGAWQEYFDVAKVPPFPFAFEDITWPEEHHHDGLAFTPLRLSACTSRFELKLGCGQRQGMLDLEIQADGARHSPEMMGERLLALLETTATNPERTLESLPVMHRNELQWLEPLPRESNAPYEAPPRQRIKTGRGGK